MADEALASMQLLLKSVPGWISDLESILATATQHQTAVVAAKQPARLSVGSIRKSLASSSRSKGSDEGALDIKQPTLLHQQLPHLSTSDCLRLSQRKRKTASVCSRVGSQSNAYRSRNMVAIYYDGATQKAFETVVRAIGNSRNSIRKGKLSLKIDNLARTGSSSSSCSFSSGEETIKGLGTFTYRSTTTTLRRPPVLPGSKDGTAAFDKVDGILEKAQMLCEQAAHQVLRDGDCSLQISQAKEHFAEVINTVEAEMPALSRKADKALERKTAEDEKYRVLVNDAPQLQNIAVSNDALLLPSEAVLEVDIAEIVDDTESEDFDLSTMKLPPSLAKFASMRSMRSQIPIIATVP